MSAGRQDPFQALERPHLIGEPLLQPFSMQLHVPMNDHGLVGGDDGVDLVRRHVEIAEHSIDRTRRIRTNPLIELPH